MHKKYRAGALFRQVSVKPRTLNPNTKPKRNPTSITLFPLSAQNKFPATQSTASPLGRRRPEVMTAFLAVPTRDTWLIVFVRSLE